MRASGMPSTPKFDVRSSTFPTPAKSNDLICGIGPATSCIAHRAANSSLAADMASTKSVHVRVADVAGVVAAHQSDHVRQMSLLRNGHWVVVNICQRAFRSMPVAVDEAGEHRRVGLVTRQQVVLAVVDDGRAGRGRRGRHDTSAGRTRGRRRWGRPGISASRYRCQRSARSEVEHPRDCVEDLHARIDRTALLEPRVPSDADARRAARPPRAAGRACGAACPAPGQRRPA